jgi:hypothetical protein
MVRFLTLLMFLLFFWCGLFLSFVYFIEWGGGGGGGVAMAYWHVFSMEKSWVFFFFFFFFFPVVNIL